MRVAIVGAGAMGRHHARIFSAMRDVELVAIVDPEPGRAEALAAAWGGTPLTDLAALPEVDAAVVATPTPLHADVAVPLIERGIHVLVEKPLAPSAVEAQRIIDAAEKAGVTLAVGHVERFNPAVAALVRLTEEPVFMQFDRLSPYTPRIGDSVVFDLMVHDLDLACLMAGGVPEDVCGAGVAVFSDTLDVATAVLRFANGTVASVSASRATQDKVRRISVSERDRFLVADCLRQDILIRRETVSEFLDDEGGTYRQASVSEIPYIDRRAEPLAAELADFIAAIRDGRPPAVDGVAGALAVRLAEQVEAAAARG